MPGEPPKSGAGAVHALMNSSPCAHPQLQFAVGDIKGDYLGVLQLT